ncbi:MAG: chorismate-binding protein, partial [Cytophagales bacterium]|nr:chorismate-binding protein [Cytophagales bacterium]
TISSSCAPVFIENEISLEKFIDSLDSNELPIEFLKLGIRNVVKSSVISTSSLPSNYTTLPTKTEETLPFKDRVNLGIECITQGLFNKVVLSDSKHIIHNQLELNNLFLNACASYPDAFVSLVSIPHVGIWLGASPELLVSYSADQVFKTVALAGTKRIENDTELKNIPWTHKEIEEQAFVARYIVSCFKKIRVREYEEFGPKTVKAGPLAHLKTDFSIDNQVVNYPDLPDVLLELLHPTSAVCGMPKETALDFILKSEKFDRKYFSGFLGPVHMDGNSHLFVNIRCMELMPRGATLYAGAGITEASDPEKEAYEIQYKMDVMGKLLLDLNA